MHIPMAYETGATGEGQRQSLLLSEQEHQWQQEMASEGAAHLPIAWFRQSPRSALTSAYGVINLIVGGVLNLGVNAGLGYAVLKGTDTVGLWQSPEAGNHPYKSAAFGDILITTFLVAYLSSLLGTPGIRGALKKGQTVPVEGNMLGGGCLTCTPVRMNGTCTKSLLLSIWALFFLAVPFILLLTAICSGGGLHGEGSQCYMSTTSYIWLKAVYAALVAMIVYPCIFLAAINSKTLPPLDLTLFLDNQKAKWEQDKRKAELPPL